MASHPVSPPKSGRAAVPTTPSRHKGLAGNLSLMDVSPSPRSKQRVGTLPTLTVSPSRLQRTHDHVPDPVTPRRHKMPASRTSATALSSPRSQQRLQGIQKLPRSLSADNIHQTLKEKLQTSYLPDEWQGELISHVFAGYDAIVCAGTGYGKSLIFEGLALLAKKGKVTIIICPLKALESDQVCPFTPALSCLLIPV